MGEMLSHCNVPSRGAAGDFSYFPSPRLVWLAVRRELQERLFSMDRILHERGAQLVLGAAVLEISLRRIFSGTERSKLENAVSQRRSRISLWMIEYSTRTFIVVL